MPKRSEIEAAQLLLRLVEARHGDAPAWAVELANSEPTDEEPPSDIVNALGAALKEAVSSKTGRFPSKTTGRYVSTTYAKRASRSTSRERVLQDLEAGRIIRRITFDLNEEDATALRLYDDANEFARTIPDEERRSE